MDELDGLAGLDQVELLRRRKLAKSRELQNALAGYEHRAYARETVQDNPLMAHRCLSQRRHISWPNWAG